MQNEKASEKVVNLAAAPVFKLSPGNTIELFEGMLNIEDANVAPPSEEEIASLKRYGIAIDPDGSAIFDLKLAKMILMNETGAGSKEGKQLLASIYEQLKQFPNRLYSVTFLNQTVKKLQDSQDLDKLQTYRSRLMTTATSVVEDYAEMAANLAFVVAIAPNFEKYKNLYPREITNILEMIRSINKNAKEFLATLKVIQTDIGLTSDNLNAISMSFSQLEELAA